MVATPLTSNCDALHDQNDAQFGYTVIVVLGTIISNIPQQYRIARRRSAEGVSSYFLITGLVSATCAVMNIVTLSLDIFRCCHNGGISYWECTSGVMGVVSYCTNWAVMGLMYVFSPIYHYCSVSIHYCPPVVGVYSFFSQLRCSVLIWSLVLPVTRWEYPDKPHPTIRDLAVVHIICSTHLLLTVAVFAILYVHSPSSLPAFARANGIISAVVAALQYAPQILTTWRLKHIGSISVPWLIVQTPGGLAAMPAQVGRPGTDWTTWLAYIGTFVGQFVLLVLCLCWTWRDWKARRKEEREMGIAREGWTWRNWYKRVWKWIFD